MLCNKNRCHRCVDFSSEFFLTWMCRSTLQEKGHTFKGREEDGEVTDLKKKSDEAAGNSLTNVSHA